MAIFFIKFHVIPTQHNLHNGMFREADVHCWIAGESVFAAYNKAHFYISKDEWNITSTETFPVEVTEEDFQDKDLGLAQYRKARETGIAILYVGVARDGKTTTDLAPLKQSRKFDLNSYLGKQKALARKGRCLHFEGGIQCGKIIGAHSIQKNGQLSLIANKGLVYSASTNVSTLKRSNGLPTLEKQGINKFSTFLGFCDKHDNQLFAPIDKSPLLPTDEQVLLYAYRSICREVFVKENALDLINSQLAELPDTSSARKFFEDFKAGTSFGLSNLHRHKTEFDNSLANGRHLDIEYVLFTTKQNQPIAFSGLFFPEFDFLANQLQNLADHRTALDLLTLCSAPMVDGWGFLFAWHKTSSRTCTEFMRSLATVTHEDVSRGADAMFGMVVSNCENVAFSPMWWESLNSEQQRVVTAFVSVGANLFAPTNPEHLAKELGGICPWNFDGVHSTMKKANQ